MFLLAKFWNNNKKPGRGEVPGFMELFNFTFQDGLWIKNNLNKTQRWLLHFHYHHPESLVLKISNRRMIDPNIG